jgi:signal transduction histidine kinase
MATLYSIRAKASLLFLFLFVLIILPVHYIIYENTKNVLAEASEREMLFDGDKIINNVRFDPLTVPVSVNYDIRLSYEENFRSDVIFSSPDFPILDEDVLLSDYVLTDTLEFLNIRKPADNTGGELLLTLTRSSESLNSQLADNRTYLFVVTGLSVILAGALVYLASAQMLKPLHRIAEAASKITASEVIDRIPLPNTNDESRTLAEALNAMLDRIERTIKNQTNFFASATHELKTPLAIMKAELSSSEFVKDERWEGILLEVERLDRVINDFLLISQLRSDSLSIRKQPHAVDEILYKGLKKITPMKERHHARIRFHLQDNTDFVTQVDLDKMETVFINLIGNAIKYSSPTDLAINLSADDKIIRILLTNPVKDPMIDPSSLTKEFKKSRELSDGLGMGLWICNEIVKLHGGWMELTSKDMDFMVLVALPRSGINTVKS